MNNLIKKWVGIGRKNLWIKQAWDPPFNERSFKHCATIEDLAYYFSCDNWSIGVAFYYEDICFINQVNGGGEWMVICKGVSFESLSGWAYNLDHIDRLQDFIQRVRQHPRRSSNAASTRRKLCDKHAN